MQIETDPDPVRDALAERDDLSLRDILGLLSDGTPATPAGMEWLLERLDRAAENQP